MPGSAHKSVRVGRPRGEAAVSHEAIMDAVYGLLEEKPARELTMEAVAKGANVGKPTLYKWWPSKAALIMAMFHERLDQALEIAATVTAEEAIRARMRRLIKVVNGLFGKVVGETSSAEISKFVSCSLQSWRVDSETGGFMKHAGDRPSNFFLVVSRTHYGLESFAEREGSDHASSK